METDYFSLDALHHVVAPGPAPIHLRSGCAFLTYCARSSADAAIAALHGQQKLDRVSVLPMPFPEAWAGEKDNTHPI